MSYQFLETEQSPSISHALPVDPFRSLYVHFGMLLGVDDFQTLDAYHRGKSWYHSAWLHGQGVNWGLKVELDTVESPENGGSVLSGELRVHPGAALDALGRELYLPAPVCLDIDAWYEKHKDEPDFLAASTMDDAVPPDEVHFNAHVSIQFKACLDRQVPALSEPCDGAAGTAAYSRVVESVELSLHPGKAPGWRADYDRDFFRVRRFLGLVSDQARQQLLSNADIQDVVNARSEVNQIADADQRSAMCLQYLRKFAILDEMEFSPVTSAARLDSRFPEEPPAAVYLANVDNIKLRLQADGAKLLDASVDNYVRPVHIPTSTIQELVCSCCSHSAELNNDGDQLPPADDANPDESGSVTPAPTDRSPGMISRNDTSADAGGPRIDESTVQFIDHQTIKMKVVDETVLKHSFGEKSVLVSTLKLSGESGKWSDAEVNSISFHRGHNTLTIKLAEPIEDAPVRVLVKGTGSYPVMNENLVPLAGELHGPPGGSHSGHDFVVTLMGESE